MVKDFGPDIRYVRTPEGAAFYGLPVGSPIRADEVSSVNRRARSVGMTPPKDSLGAPTATDRPVVAEMAGPSEKIYTVGDPTIAGPLKFKVGSREYSAPEGSRIFRPADSNGVRYVLTPDGEIHAFNSQGEVFIPERFQRAVKARLGSGDGGYEEGSFRDGGASMDADRAAGAAIGSVLTDDDDYTWTKISENEWEHDSGFKATNDEIQPYIDSGELRFSSSSSSAEVPYSQMGRDTFIRTLDEKPDGFQLVMTRGDDRITLTKKGNVWEPDAADGMALDSRSLYFFQRSIEDAPETPEEPEGAEDELTPDVLSEGDHATEEWVKSAPEGAQIASWRREKYGDLASTWTKQADGTWKSEATGKVVEEATLVNGARNGKVLIVRTGPAEDSENERLFPGAEAYDEQVLQDALDSLTVHTGFQILYGLPRTSPLRDKEIVGALTTHARSLFPDLSPKEAVKAHLRNLLGIEEPTEGDTDTSEDGDQIVVGSADPKKVGVQGMNGGKFSRAEIEQAIEILEEFQGKAYKSELNKKGNPLGVLDPTSMVGIHKDKTEGKRKFIEYLRGILGDGPTTDPEPTPPPAPEEKQTADLDFLYDAPMGAMVSVEGTSERKFYTKNGEGYWEADNGDSLSPEQLIDLWEGQDILIEDFGPEPEPRNPGEWFGSSPETVKELDALPAGSFIRFLGEYYYRNPGTGLWHLAKDDSIKYGTSSESFDGMLRGITFVSWPSHPEDRHDEAQLVDIEDALDREGDAVRPGDTLFVVQPSGAYDVYRRVPTISGDGGWLDTNGNVLGDAEIEEKIEEGTTGTSAPYVKVRRLSDPQPPQDPGLFSGEGEDIPAPEPEPVSENETSEPQPGDQIRRPMEELTNRRLTDFPVGTKIRVVAPDGKSIEFTRVANSFDDDHMWRNEETGETDFHDNIARFARNWGNAYNPGSQWEVEGDVVPGPEPEPEPGPTDVPAAPGDEILGADRLRTLPVGTRLIYTRRDGKKTVYNVRWLDDGQDFKILVTDRGTEVEIERATRMRFVVAEVGSTPDAPTPPTPPTPPSDPQVPNFTRNGVGVGGAIRKRADLWTALPGDQFVDNDGTYWTKTHAGWVENNPDARKRRLLQDYNIRRTAGFRWTRITSSEDDSEMAWDSPPIDFEYIPDPRFAGSEIPRENRSSELHVMPVGSRIALTSQRTGATEIWTRFNGDFYTNGNETSFLSPTELEIYGNYMLMDMKVDVRGEGDEFVNTRPVEDPEDIETARVGTHLGFQVKPDLFVHIRKVSKGWWESDNPAVPIFSDMELRGHVSRRAISTGDGQMGWESLEKLDNRSAVTALGEMEELPVGAMIRRHLAYYRKKDENTWEILAGGATTPFSQADLANIISLSPETMAPVQLVSYGTYPPADPGQYISPADIFKLTERSAIQVENIMYVRTSDGWRGSSAYSTELMSDLDIIHQITKTTSHPAKRLDDLGPLYTAEDMPEIGSQITSEDLLRLPVGTTFTRTAEGRDLPIVYTIVGEMKIRSDRYGATGVGDLLTTMSRENENFVLTSFEADVATVKRGERINWDSQLEQLPLGAIIRTESGGVIRKIGDNEYAALDKWNYTRTYSADGIISRYDGMTYADDVVASGDVVTSDDALANAPVGSILYSPTHPDAYQKTVDGQWLQNGTKKIAGNPMAGKPGNEFRLITDVGSLATEGKKMSQYEVKVAKNGTKIKLNMPPELGSANYNGYWYWDSEKKVWIRERGLRGAQVTGAKIKQLSLHQMELAAWSGYVSLDKQVGDPIEHPEFVEKMRVARTKDEIEDLFRAQYSDVQLTSPRNLHSTADNKWTAQMKLETYRDYLIEWSRLFEEYPMMREMQKISAESDHTGNNRNAMAWVYLTGNIANTTTVVNTRYRMDEAASAVERSLRTNFFHGLTKPGISNAMTTATHEFGHVFDSWSGRQLNKVAKAKWDELYNAANVIRQAEMKREISDYAKTNDFELVAESFENWHNNVEVEPTTEAIMMAMEEWIRENKIPGFKFVKNPGLPDGPSYVHNGQAVSAEDRGSRTAKPGNEVTARELWEAPIGSEIKTADGRTWTKESRGMWRDDGEGFIRPSNGFVDGSAPKDGKILWVSLAPNPGTDTVFVPKIGATVNSAAEMDKAPVGTRVISAAGTWEYIKVNDLRAEADGKPQIKWARYTPASPSNGGKASTGNVIESGTSIFNRLVTIDGNRLIWERPA